MLYIRFLLSLLTEHFDDYRHYKSREAWKALAKAKLSKVYRKYDRAPQLDTSPEAVGRWKETAARVRKTSNTIYNHLPYKHD